MKRGKCSVMQKGTILGLRDHNDEQIGRSARRDNIRLQLGPGGVHLNYSCNSSFVSPLALNKFLPSNLLADCTGRDLDSIQVATEGFLQ